MSRTLTASDRKNLIRLAAEMPKGSPERRAILAGLKKAKLGKLWEKYEADWDLASALERDALSRFPGKVRTLDTIVRGQGQDDAQRRWKRDRQILAITVNTPEAEAYVREMAKKHRREAQKTFSGWALVSSK